MAFKYEPVDEKLRKQICREVKTRHFRPEIRSSIFLDSLKVTTVWTMDYERNILLIGSPSVMKKRDGDYSEDFWLKFRNMPGDNLCGFTLEPGEIVPKVTLSWNKEKPVTYHWEKLLWHNICAGISFAEAMAVLKEGVSVFEAVIPYAKECPNYRVKFDFMES